jgi:hypothetical protein
LNGTHKIQLYVANINFMRENINTKKENTETFGNVSKDVILEINTCLCPVTIMHHKIIT